VSQTEAEWTKRVSVERGKRGPGAEDRATEPTSEQRLRESRRSGAMIGPGQGMGNDMCRHRDDEEVIRSTIVTCRQSARKTS
jgi:hypothetical protein